MKHMVAAGLRHFAIIAMLSFFIWASAAHAEQNAARTSPVYQLNDAGPSMEQVMARLQRAETALSELQAQQMSPAVPAPDAYEEFNATYYSTDSLVARSLQPAGNKEEDDQSEEEEWYEKLSLRGYLQVRINEVTHLAPGSAPAHLVGDRSVGDNESFLIRRARLVVAGDVSEHMGIYMQTDFANTPPGSSDATYFAVMRDWYADCYFDTTKVHRIRVGQSKLPYGWENMQSSGNRVPLDRSDGMNSAVRNERDLGVFYYWTPEPAQEFFKNVLDWGLKGSGNYGVFGCGFYNGQGGSLMEQNDNLHFVARLTLPYTFENCQMMEIGIQGYTGMFTVLSTPISPLGIGPAVRPLGTLETGNDDGLLDKRIAASFIWYPQPFGFQAEWNVGEGPALNDAQTEVVVRSLQGGYVMCLYKYDSPCHGTFFPFARYATYRGGYKQERNAPYASVDEFDFGLEWQINDQIELVGEYVFTDRTNTVAMNAANVESYRQFEGQIIRFHCQFNY